eukprot:3166704-Pyramimonas_sp.AAC.1
MRMRSRQAAQTFAFALHLDPCSVSRPAVIYKMRGACPCPPEEQTGSSPDPLGAHFRGRPMLIGQSQESWFVLQESAV